MKISFIISTYNRTTLLKGCLFSLLAQTHRDIEIIVVDNSVIESIKFANQAAALQASSHGIDVFYLSCTGPTCYHSSEQGAAMASGDYLCFPSDDSYYMPTFAKRVAEAVAATQADLVFSNMVYGDLNDRRPYSIMDTQPRLYYIDKTGFVLNKKKFHGFPGKPNIDQACECDGLLINELMAQGITYQKINEVLLVHN